MAVRAGPRSAASRRRAHWCWPRRTSCVSSQRPISACYAAPLKLTAHLVDNSATLPDAATVNLSTAGATGGATAYSTATVTIGETVANPITAIGIGDDTGTSATDGVASDPKLIGTAAPGTVLSIFDGAKLLGTTTADSTGAWSYTPTGLADGAHLFSTLQSGSEVVFDGRDSSTKFLLWETDGTSAGTFELPVPNAGNLQPDGIVTVGNEFFFAGGSGGLWVSNGTAGGTVQIGGQSPTDLTAFGNKLLFGANHSSLWITDGTAAGTTALKNVAEDQIAVIGSEAFFVSGTSLWKTGRDGKWNRSGDQRACGHPVDRGARQQAPDRRDLRLVG